MKIFITGASGFIGSNLANFFSRKKNTIICNYYKRKISFKGVSIKKLSLLNKINLNEKIDAIIHCASKTPVNCSNNYTIYNENLKMMNSLIDLAIKKNIKKFVFLSSVSVYGKINKRLLKESYKPKRPNLYGRSKLLCENALNELVKHNIDFISIRLPVVVGPNSHSNFISKITKRIIENKKITAKNKNSYFNNIVFIEDLSKFIHNFLFNKKKFFRVINIGSSYKMKILNVVNYLYNKFNRKKKIRWTKGKSKSFLIDLTNAKKSGFRPSSVKASLEKYTDIVLKTL